MYYFAYGSNMNIDRLTSRGVIFTSVQSSVLKDYRLEFNKLGNGITESGYANIIQDITSQVEGLLYEIPEESFFRLDTIEGVPFHYIRTILLINTGPDTQVEAEVYIANPDKVRNGLMVSKEYLSHLLKGKDYLSKAYYSKLEGYLLK